MEKIVQTAGKNALGEFAPEFAHFNDDVLFGENWNNQDIDVKTRSIITVVALMASGITDSSLKYHLQNAKNHGVTQKEIAAVITHVAFYAGWPKAWAVFNLAKEVWETGEGDLPYEEEAMRAHAKEMVFPIGEPNDGFAQYFSGRSFLAPISTSQVGIFNVTFEPGCRNNWHIHHAKSGGGQILVCVAGRGYYQVEGKEAVEMKPGDCINIPAEVKHWHGAASDEWFSHLAIEVPGENSSNEWLEPVSDEEYRKATTEAESRYAEANEVLTAREQAIVAVASYTGKGDLEHLKPAFAQALEAGMTINEINEVLIHAYAYCGFPRSLRAIQTFMQVVDERKADGINDPVGRKASAIKDNRSRYERGRDVLAEISGTPADTPKAGYAVFAPTIERFLKEHLFADLFGRDLLTYRERELATVSILAGVGGVEPMACGHMSICLHLGITPSQLSALLNIVEMNLGKTYAEPLRKVLNQITEKK